MKPQTLFEKIWDAHVVHTEPNGPSMLYIDFQLVHEVTSPQAFQGLRDKGLRMRRPLQTLATIDHSIPTTDPNLPIADAMAAAQIKQLESNCQEFDVPIHKDRRGVVHVIGPELGFTQPGMTIVCGDSHTATHGAFGALAFGIGTSEVEHVLATQTLLQTKPKTMKVEIDGKLVKGVSAKDIILALIAKIGVGGGTGYVLEYSGSTMRGLDMEARMTICNMSIEAGARAGMVAPDEFTYSYLADKPFVPKGARWDKALQWWKSLPSDADARYDATVILHADALKPMITFGTNPGMGIGIDENIPNPDDVKDVQERQSLVKALQYMGLSPKQKLLGQKIDVVFIGSCTNGRLSDLYAAAQIMHGRKVAPNTRVLVVPGSQAIKRQAEVDGLDKIFTAAGAEWRESGCSMCIAMNGDQIQPGQYAVSTSNRNFEGRQGKGGRTLLASPLTAAAAAVTGEVTDPRTLL
jgi:3-isopropylmalate/(R)-2-methylmalate dehydratase large subunit